MGIWDYVKETWRLNSEYYGIETKTPTEEQERKQVREPPKTKTSEYWPYDNNVDIKKMSRAEQHERELRIQMYMEAYPFLPFQISDSFLYRPNTSWTTINQGGQAVVLSSLKELNDIIIGFRKNKNVIYEYLPYDIKIPYERVCFDHSGKVGQPPRSFIEYRPFTSAAKRCKEPLIVHFTTIKEFMRVLNDECAGEMTYGLDGTVVSAKVGIFKNNRCYSYSFGMVGRTFTISKITTPNEQTSKQAVLYDNLWDFMEY